MGYDGDGDGDELGWRWMSAVWRCQSREGGGRIRPEGTHGGVGRHMRVVVYLNFKFGCCLCFARGTLYGVCHTREAKGELWDYIYSSNLPFLLLVYGIKYLVLEVLQHVVGAPFHIVEDVQPSLRLDDGQTETLGRLHSGCILASPAHQADACGQLRHDGHFYRNKNTERGNDKNHYCIHILHRYSYSLHVCSCSCLNLD